MKKGSIAIDFDGVIHKYSKGWQDGSVYDELMPGTIEAIEKLMENWHVFIFSARPEDQIVEYLQPKVDDKGILVVKIQPETLFWNDKGHKVIGVTNRKLPAIHYIDDRAILFTNWNETLKKII